VVRSDAVVIRNAAARPRRTAYVMCAANPWPTDSPRPRHARDAYRSAGRRLYDNIMSVTGVTPGPRRRVRT
jgi:hypothetical protein